MLDTDRYEERIYTLTRPFFHLEKNSGDIYLTFLYLAALLWCLLVALLQEIYELLATVRH
jgi:hypothetical protein